MSLEDASISSNGQWTLTEKFYVKEWMLSDLYFRKSILPIV